MSQDQHSNLNFHTEPTDTTSLSQTATIGLALGCIAGVALLILLALVITISRRNRRIGRDAGVEEEAGRRARVKSSLAARPRTKTPSGRRSSVPSRGSSHYHHRAGDSRYGGGGGRRRAESYRLDENRRFQNGLDVLSGRGAQGGVAVPNSAYAGSYGSGEGGARWKEQLLVPPSPAPSRMTASTRSSAALPSVYYKNGTRRMEDG